MRGWVYVISNKSMPGIIKIGHTLKDPDIRAQELDHTGVPHHYIVDYEILIENPQKIEQNTHKLLAKYNEKKEWFRCSIDVAISAIKESAGAATLLENIKCDLSKLLSEVNFGGTSKNKEGLIVKALQNKGLEQNDIELEHISNILKDRYPHVSEENIAELVYKSYSKDDLAAIKDQGSLANHNNKQAYSVDLTDQKVDSAGRTGQQYYNWGYDVIKYPDLAVRYMSHAAELGHIEAKQWIEENKWEYYNYLLKQSENVIGLLNCFECESHTIAKRTPIGIITKCTKCGDMNYFKDEEVLKNYLKSHNNRLL